MHLDLVALREPVTCRLPTDPADAQRVVRQFRAAEIDRHRQATAMVLNGQQAEAVGIYLDLLRYALPGITDEEIDALGMQDIVRLLAAAQNKSAMVEDALGNGRGGGDSSGPTENPPPATPALSTTTDEPPSLPG